MYILDKKVVTDTEEFSNQAYGITLSRSTRKQWFLCIGVYIL